MRKFSLVFAAATVVVALAVSGSAWAVTLGQAAEKILIEGKILGVSGNNDTNNCTSYEILVYDSLDTLEGVNK